MRECGECEICCEIAEIKEEGFFKPAFQKCPHQCGGCAIYGKLQRPGVCNSYQCSWTRGFGNEEDRPDTNGIMVSIDRMEGFDWITIIELKPNAVLTTGKSIILDIVSKVKLPALVFDYETPPPKLGDRVIIHRDIDSRCNSLKGDFLETLNDDISIYKLNLDN